MIIHRASGYVLMLRFTIEMQGIMMSRLSHILFLNDRRDTDFTRWFSDIVLALAGAFFITAIIAVLQLSFIRNISLLYLFIVWILAVRRGLYAAACASLFSFISFDFFFVQPLYQFTISNPDEWVALFFFLATAIVTGVFASILRQSVKDSQQREHEARDLYELVKTTASERDERQQLEIVVSTIKAVFAPAGVRDCSILFAIDMGRNIQWESIPATTSAPTEAELATRNLVLRQGKKEDLYDVPVAINTSNGYVSRAIIRHSSETHVAQRYIRLIPLHIGQRVIGIVRLIIEDNPKLSADEQLLSIRSEPVSKHSLWFDTAVSRILDVDVNHENALLQPSFFEAFLDQITLIIESARLRRESLQIEVLQKTDALRSALLSSVSHDLRTPLSSIKAAAYSLQEKDVQWSDEDRRSFAMTIEREADRLNRLVGNILDMSRIEGGALKPEKELYPLQDVIYSVVDHMQFALKERTVRIDIPEELPPVELDFLQIDQVLTNLIENATRYTPPESPIEISAEAHEHEIIVSVSDRGQGIPVHDMERVFDKFYRVMGTRRKGSLGTGLGLAVSRGLIEAHGGRIWVENRGGGGAIFRFTLPTPSVQGVEEVIHG